MGSLPRGDGDKMTGTPRVLPQKLAPLPKPAPAEDGKPRTMTPHDLIGMVRVGSPEVHPNGNIVFSAKKWDFDESKWEEHLYLTTTKLALETSEADRQSHKHITQLTKSRGHNKNNSPQFSPCGKYVAFLSNRTADNTTQIFIIPIGEKMCGEAQQLTKFAAGIGISDLLWHKSGCMLFSSEVYVDFDESVEDTIAATLERDQKAAKENKSNAILYSSLPVRNWDHWCGAKRCHIFRMEVVRSKSRDLFSAETYFSVASPFPKDLLRSAGLGSGECPVPAFGGREDFSLSLDGCKLAVSMREPLQSDEAWTTNRHIYLITLDEESGGKSGDQAAKRRKLDDKSGFAATSVFTCLTTQNPGYDMSPTFSPDGKSLAWLSMETPQYEADKTFVRVYDLQNQSTETFCKDWNYSHDSLRWSPDGKAIVGSYNMGARRKLFHLDLSKDTISSLGTPSVGVSKLNISTQTGGSFDYCGEDAGGIAVCVGSSLMQPADIYVFDKLKPQAGSSVTTHFDREKVERLARAGMASLQLPGSGGEGVSAWFLPPAIDGIQLMNLEEWHKEARKKSAPLAVIIHGGPQSAIFDAWHYRWNLQSYAARGFAVLAINFHGSTGFGHKFTKSISGDWGGAPCEDIIKGVEHVLNNFPALDPERVCALGASYGGFMVNYLNGNAPKGMFRCLVCHDGVFGFESSYYTTEELFFMETEFTERKASGDNKSDQRFGTKREMDMKFSPHLKSDKWETPCLVIHGSKDYRLCETEGIATFQALQRRGIPSELLIFPDENHWVLNPNNSLVWHEKVLSWIERWCK